MKQSNSMLLADVTLCCRMYPAAKVDISRHLAILGFPVQMLVYCVVGFPTGQDSKTFWDKFLGQRDRRSFIVLGQTGNGRS